MMCLPSLPRGWKYGVVFFAGLLATWLICSGANGEQGKTKLLHIGVTGALESGRNPAEKKAALATLKKFIETETGFANEIVEEKDWQTLAEQLANGRIQLGALHGFEFAWAKQRYPALQLLALAVNGHTYLETYLVVRKDSKATNFAGLQGQSIAMLGHSHGAFARLYVDRECQANNKKPKDFFSKIVIKDNVEDILDDVVDGTEQAAVVERIGLEAYKRRKPGRFNRLKEIAKSPQVVPALIAYYDNKLDAATLARFRKGMLSANQKEKGQTLLTMFRLTGFEAVPADFKEKLLETQKAFPAPSAAK